MSKSFINKSIEIQDHQGFNEFACIKGLKPSICRWLRESYDVQTIDDLAHLSISQVLANPTLVRLKDENKVVCRRNLERWIRQAQEMMAEQSVPWHTFATFVIALQSRQGEHQTEQRTTAYFLEANRNVVWSGIACDGAHAMMLEQLAQILQGQPEVACPMPPDESDEFEAIAQQPPVTPEPVPLTLDIIQATFWQGLESREPARETGGTEAFNTTAAEPAGKIRKTIQAQVASRTLPQPLQTVEPFDVELTFQISGAGAIELTHHGLPYYSEFYLQNQETGALESLGRSWVRTLEAGELHYTSQLKRVVLREPGAYRLQTITKLVGSSMRPFFWELSFSGAGN